jgi:ERCC4-type nuclease
MNRKGLLVTGCIVTSYCDFFNWCCWKVKINTSNGVIYINAYQNHYKYTDKEMKELLRSITVLVDTREQQHQHILDYFDSKKIPYKFIKIEVGDYAVSLPANPELGIIRDMYFPIAVERKNSVDELVQSIKNRVRFENELIRSKEIKFILMVEDTYENLVVGNYRSQYNPRALLASLKTFEARYGFTTVFVPRKFTGNYVFHHLYYHVRNCLKGNN